jgi:hypothetical protein
MGIHDVSDAYKEGYYAGQRAALENKEQLPNSAALKRDDLFRLVYPYCVTGEHASRLVDRLSALPQERATNNRYATAQEVIAEIEKDGGLISPENIRAYCRQRLNAASGTSHS